ncbi:cytochrome P450 [Kiritimatiellota bacterium B12222]|nr:cytochrome P450 [Kiritimatiellota bacterium B12222]
MSHSTHITHTTPEAFDPFIHAQTPAPDLFPGTVPILNHKEMVAILADHERYSNAVSQHLSVPNGMDPPEHGPFRKLIEPYFSASRMQDFEPACRDIAKRLIASCAKQGDTDIMRELATPYVLQIQCAWMGWPQEIHDDLWQWWQESRKAMKTGDRNRIKQQADHFTAMVQTQIDERRQLGENAPQDLTTELMKEQVNGKPLSDDEIISILRNWTAGEVGTLSASVAIILHFCAEHPDIQNEIRQHPAQLETAIDEILRLHAPLLTNRRVTRCPVEHAGTTLPENTKLTLVWQAANRDPETFPCPHAFKWDRDPDQNLLWGKGIHVCPGAPLAKLQLRMFMEELFTQIQSIHPGKIYQPASFPETGFEALFLQLT